MQSIFLHCNVRRDYMKFRIFHAKPTSSGGKGVGWGWGVWNSQSFWQTPIAIVSDSRNLLIYKWKKNRYEILVRQEEDHALEKKKCHVFYLKIKMYFLQNKLWRPPYIHVDDCVTRNLPVTSRTLVDSRFYWLLHFLLVLKAKIHEEYHFSNKILWCWYSISEFFKTHLTCLICLKPFACMKSRLHYQVFIATNYWN